MITSHFMGEERTLVPEIGQRYKVVPMNIAKAKNAGRVCILLELDDDFMPQKGTVKWADTGRKGSVKLSDLVLAKNE
jgi:hypothetical protein